MQGKSRVGTMKEGGPLCCWAMGAGRPKPLLLHFLVHNHLCPAPLLPALPSPGSPQGGRPGASGSPALGWQRSLGRREQWVMYYRAGGRGGGPVPSRGHCVSILCQVWLLALRTSALWVRMCPRHGPALEQKESRSWSLGCPHFRPSGGAALSSSDHFNARDLLCPPSRPS